MLYLVTAGPHFPGRETEVLKGQVTCCRFWQMPGHPKHPARGLWQCLGLGACSFLRASSCATRLPFAKRAASALPAAVYVTQPLPIHAVHMCPGRKLRLAKWKGTNSSWKRDVVFNTLDKWGGCFPFAETDGNIGARSKIIS